jgi:hypothetical protein
MTRLRRLGLGRSSDRRSGTQPGTTLTRDDVAMARRAATHEIHVNAGRGVVIKRFRSWDRREPAREWIALLLLAEFAPGLAATPVRADLTADPPVIEMSRLPGAPLGGIPLSAAQADALALALGRLWHAVPRATLTDPDGPGPERLAAGAPRHRNAGRAPHHG